MESLIIPALIVIALGSLLAGLAHKHEKTKWVFISIALVGFAIALIPLWEQTNELNSACLESNDYYSCQNELKQWGPVAIGTMLVAAEAAACSFIGFAIERHRRPTVGSRKRLGNSRRFQV